MHKYKKKEIFPFLMLMLTLASARFTRTFLMLMFAWYV